MMKHGSETQEGMHRRRIMLKDGRYLIFYTFDDEGESEGHNETALDEPGTTGTQAVEPQGNEDV